MIERWKDNLEARNFKEDKDSGVLEVGMSLDDFEAKIENKSQLEVIPVKSVSYLIEVIPEEKLNKDILSKNDLLSMLNKWSKPEELEEFLRVHGKSSLSEVASSLVLDDKKLNKIWEVGQKKNIDPRFLLAILFAEGTGSFDSRIDSRGGIWSIDSDFDRDLKVTANTILNYLVPSEQNPYSNICWQELCPESNPIEFIGRGSCPGMPASGGYASDSIWPDKVKNIYGMLGGYVLKDENNMFVPPLYDQQAKYSAQPPHYMD